MRVAKRKGTLYRRDGQARSMGVVIRVYRTSKQRRAIADVHNTMRDDGSIEECPSPERSANKGES